MVQHAAPDVICFLGDLMDEGSVANDDQFAAYFTRFVNIFSQPTANTIMVRMSLFITQIRANFGPDNSFGNAPLLSFTFQVITILEAKD